MNGDGTYFSTWQVKRTFICDGAEAQPQEKVDRLCERIAAIVRAENWVD